jgi:hypothetical protein
MRRSKDKLAKTGGAMRDVTVELDRIVFWALAGHLCAGPYQEVINSGSAHERVAAALAGAALGWLGSLVAGVAGGGGMLVAGVGISAVAWWCVPLGVAWLLHGANVYAMGWVFNRTKANPWAILRAKRYPRQPGDFNRDTIDVTIWLVTFGGLAAVGVFTWPRGGPSFSTWMTALSIVIGCFVGNALVTSLSTIADRSAAVSRFQPRDAVVRVAGIATLTLFIVVRTPESALTTVALLAMFATHVHMLGILIPMTRYRFHEAELSAVVTVLVASLLASSPMGRDVLRPLEHLPIASAAAVVAVVGALGALWLRRSHDQATAFPLTVAPVRARVRRVVTSVYPVLLFVPWLVVLAGNRWPLGEAALRSITALALFILAGITWASGPLGKTLTRFDAVVFGRSNPPWWDRGRAETAWRNDLRKNHPDLRLVLAMAAEGRRTTVGWPIGPTGYSPASGASAGTVQSPAEIGLDWIESALTLLESAAEQRKLLTHDRQYRFAAALCHTALAEVFRTLGHPEDSTLEYAQAAEECVAGEMPNLEAFLRLEEQASLLGNPRCTERIRLLIADRRVSFSLRVKLAAELARAEHS